MKKNTQYRQKLVAGYLKIYLGNAGKSFDQATKDGSISEIGEFAAQAALDSINTVLGFHPDWSQEEAAKHFMDTIDRELYSGVTKTND